MGGLVHSGDFGVRPDDTTTGNAAARPARAGGAGTSTRHGGARRRVVRYAGEEASPTRPLAYNRRLYVELCRTLDLAVPLLVLGAVFVYANTGWGVVRWSDFLLVRLNVTKLLELGVFALVWRQIFRFFGLYQTDYAARLSEEAPRIVGACSVGVLASVGFTFLSATGAFRMAIPLVAWLPMVIATLSARYTVQKLAERGNSHTPKRVLVVGSGPLAWQFHRELSDGRDGGVYELVGFVDSNPDVRYPEIRARMVGSLDEFEQILMHMVVDEVFVALPIKSHYTNIQRVIEECERAGVQSKYSPDVFRTTIASPRLQTSDPLPAVALLVSPDDERLLVKRAIDIVGAALGLLLTGPVLLGIALAIKASGPGPVLFAQERYGLRKRRFRMLKFRTMVPNAEALQADLEHRNEADGPVFKIADDPRVTRVGRILRKLSLDELPQLWNVLKGEMSLVGPRPLPERDVRRFGEPWLMRRFSVAPGMTGLWQISGRSDTGFDEWIALDLEYIDRWSLGLDLRILIATLPAVFRGTGAS